MGRRRKRNTHLPPCMMHRHGAYYLLARANGKQRWLPLGRDYGVALREWARLTGEDRTTQQTVAEMLAAYIADKRQTLATRTIAGYQAQAETLGKVFGNMRPQDVTRADVYHYIKQRGNVAGNRERDLLRAAYNYAANTGYTGPNPALGMRVRNPEPPRQRYVTDAELAALVLAAKPRLANLILFLYLTAMRIGDAIALPLTAARADGIHWREGKTGRPRHVEWSPELERVWKSAAGSRIGAQPAFLGQRGPYTLDGLESTWSRVRKRAGLPDIRLHDLRRKAASDLPLEDAQRLLGHASPGITQRHYRARPDAVRPTR